MRRSMITLNVFFRQIMHGSINLILLIILLFVAQLTFSQPATPKFQSYQSITITQPSSIAPIQLRAQPNATFHNDPHAELNRQILLQSRVIDIPGQPNSRQQQLNELKAVMQEEAMEAKAALSKLFESRLHTLLQMDPDHFSITKAIYLTESAFDPSLPPFETFEGAIKEWAELVKQIAKREGLSSSNNLAVNYAIQKLYTQYNTFYNPREKKSYSIPPLRYDFNDFMGDKDWSKMFVSKLLRTKTGQCHSLPLFFLCVAEQLNARAWLSLSPNHSFIQYFDEKGKRYNFEPTNGNLVTQTWLMQSTYVNATALKNKTYLDTLSSRKLYAQCLSDLLLGYLMKLGYDQYSRQLTGQILAIDSSNITALMTQANYYTFIFRDEAQKAGNPPQSNFADFPRVQVAFKRMQEAVQKVQKTGFQQMPEKEYQKWLKSLELEKQKQQNKIEQQRLQQEIKKLKNIKSVIINQPKQ